MGRVLGCTKAKCKAPPAEPEARGLSSPKGSPGTFQRYSAITSISQRSFFGSSRTATQDRAGLPVKYSA